MSSAAPVNDLIDDLRVLRLVTASDELPITRSVAASVWGWFGDVEFSLPIPEMPIGDSERTRLVLEICDDMIDTARHVAALRPTLEASPETAPLHQRLDVLWRELAGALAPVLNATLPEPTAEEEYPRAITQLAAGFTQEEWQNHLKDPSVRMSLRRLGLDPDKLQ